MSFILRRFRLLPLTACVAAVFLLFKISEIWTGATTVWQQGIVVAEAQAASSSSPAKAPRPISSDPDDASHSAAPAANDLQQTAVRPDSTSTDAHEDQEFPVSQGFTSSEIKVLQQLSARREELINRAENIERRESLLKAAELRIDQKLKNMKSLQATLEALITAHENQQDTQLASVVKIYETMKAKDAARIFEELDMRILIEVAQRMKERKLAPILAKVDPTKAKQLTENLAQLRSATPAQKQRIPANKS